MVKLQCDRVPCDWLHGLIRNLIGHAAKKMPCVNECVTLKNVSKAVERGVWEVVQ